MQDGVSVSAALVTGFAEHADERRGEHQVLHLADEGVSSAVLIYICDEFVSSQELY
jgi:hypothetical protein